MVDGPKFDFIKKTKEDLDVQKRDIRIIDIVLTILIAVTCIVLIARIFYAVP